MCGMPISGLLTSIILIYRSTGIVGINVVGVVNLGYSDFVNNPINLLLRADDLQSMWLTPAFVLKSMCCFGEHRLTGYSVYFSNRSMTLVLSSRMWQFRMATQWLQ